MNINILGATKFVVSGIVGIGAGKIVGSVIKNNIKPETLIDKVTVSAAAWVVAAIVSERSKNFTDEMIDDVVKLATDVAVQIKTAEKLARINSGESTFEKEKLDPTNFRRNPKNNAWEKVKTIGGETLEQKLYRLNRGETTFAAEGLRPERFRKNNTGDWEPCAKVTG